ncbi:MAG: GNAT family N-acetyltransferase [Chloroflexota bacterium]
MSEVTVAPVQNEAELLAFIQFPWEVYRQDPYWVPPLISERRAFLDRNSNPFFQHARVEFFLARRGEKIVGTIAAFTNDLYNQFQVVNTGFFGFFEVLDDPQAAAALLLTAENWARRAGHQTLLGPAQFSTNDECGLLVDGFDDPPRILMTYNPQRYRDYLEAGGYTKAMDLWAYALPLDVFASSTDRLPVKLIRVAEKVMHQGKFTVRRLDMKRFDQEVEAVKHVYNTSWERNWGFVPMTDPEFDHMGKQLKSIIDPDLVVIVERDGKMVGFGLTLPDLNQPLHKAYPRPGTPELATMLKLLWHWKVMKRVDWLRVFALGVLPEYRGQGVDALMYYETAKSAFRKGYKWCEMSWILENNVMMNRAIQFLGGKVYKTYRFYEKRL